MSKKRERYHKVNEIDKIELELLMVQNKNPSDTGKSTKLAKSKKLDLAKGQKVNFANANFSITDFITVVTKSIYISTKNFYQKIDSSVSKLLWALLLIELIAKWS